MSKETLNTLSTVLGLIAGGSQLLGGAGVVNRQVTDAISGLSTAMLGYLVQQPSR